MSRILFFFFVFAIASVSNFACAQNFVATIDGDVVKVLAGGTEASPGDWGAVTFFDPDGSATTEILDMVDDETFLRLNPTSQFSEFQIAEVHFGDGSTSVGLFLFNDSVVLENCVPLDIDDPLTWSGCEVVSHNIWLELGCYAVQHDIRPLHPARFLPPYRDVTITPAWKNHRVVVKFGRVYDGFGPAEGLSIADYKNLWGTPQDQALIDFGF